MVKLVAVLLGAVVTWVAWGGIGLVIFLLFIGSMATSKRGDSWERHKKAEEERERDWAANSVNKDSVNYRDR